MKTKIEVLKTLIQDEGLCWDGSVACPLRAFNKHPDDCPYYIDEKCVTGSQPVIPIDTLQRDLLKQYIGKIYEN